MSKETEAEVRFWEANRADKGAKGDPEVAEPRGGQGDLP